MNVLAVCLNPALDREFFIDQFTLNKLNMVPSEKSRMSPGGKGVNVATILSKYGISLIVTGFLGGYVGYVLISELRKASPLISTSFVNIRDETRENIVITDTVNHELTEINSEGPFVSPESVDIFLRKFEVLVQKVQTVVISGSVPKGIPLSFYGELTKIAKKYDKTVFWEARDEIISESMKIALPDVIKYDMRRSEKILGKILSKEEEYIATARDFVKNGTKLVILSYKTIHDFIGTADGVWKFSPKVDIDHSFLLGSGDNFVAAMVLAQLEGKCCIDMARYGYAAAVAKTAYIGKEPPSRGQIREYMNFIISERVD
ncbi:MAG TPA: PfkB family carbohydrate kinase [Fervidobacterium sp.]|nr:ribokinase [Fervidobacterium sp.]HOK87869.1 PfkB family carbohydrate kinase [Fervidobacterium sp.]HOM74407.1 PfkB family carbohydrate kinase [Fervidobacterium sp.]HOQ39723.1 PfkB family carbohydrate kinase [Fervidobacterium sp.]HPP18273.1 PfkB family carbohydrate kinase [Fervidobacterium sp.]